MHNKLFPTVSEITHYYHYTHESGYVFPGHRHPCYELNALLSGEMEVTCDESVYRLHPGDYILLPPYIFHRNRVLGDSSADMIVIHFHADCLFSPSCSCAITMTNEQLQLLKLICIEFEKRCDITKGLCSENSKSGCNLLEVFLDYNNTGNHTDHKLSSDKTAVYQTAVRYMRENLTTPVQLSDIAKACNVSVSTLKSIFSRYTGIGCMSFFMQLRLDAAKLRLERGHTCSEVSNAIGFSSQAYFSKCFKEYFGFLPSSINRSRR